MILVIVLSIPLDTERLFRNEGCFKKLNLGNFYHKTMYILLILSTFAAIYKC